MTSSLRRAIPLYQLVLALTIQARELISFSVGDSSSSRAPFSAHAANFFIQHRTRRSTIILPISAAQTFSSSSSPLGDEDTHRVRDVSRMRQSTIYHSSGDNKTQTQQHLLTILPIPATHNVDSLNRGRSSSWY